jgi:enoyl-CoA hydratase/carnithine racemase
MSAGAPRADAASRSDGEPRSGRSQTMVGLETTRRGDVVELLLPGGRDARLTPDLHGELHAAASEIDLDETVRAVLLRSRGPDFCRGATQPATRPDGIAAIASLRAPVIALVQGHALDEGLELALACDLRLVTADAKLGLTQVGAGRVPVHGGTQRLPRIVGYARALQMILLAQVVGGARAVALGLAMRSVPRARLGAEGRKLAAAVAARGPIAQRLGKEALRAAGDLPLAEGLRLEGDLYVLLQSTRDRDEGIASFRERRQPRFRGA